MDLILAAVEEIAFDGLEGTSFAGLIGHLKKHSPPINTSLDVNTQRFIWNGLLTCDDIQYYFVDKSKIPPEDKSTKPYMNRKPHKETVEHFPQHWIYDKDGTVYGFSPSYHYREDITAEIKEIGFDEAMSKYGDSLYLVGNQDLRMRTLIGESVIPELSSILIPLRYIMLEIIGKTRTEGFIQMNFKKYSFDPRSSFHHMKLLMKHDLITKQTRVFTDSVGKSVLTKILFHKDFHHQSAIKSAKLAQTICNILSEAPNCAMEFKDLKAKIPESAGLFKKIRRWLLVNGYIRYIYEGNVIGSDESVRIIPSKSHFIQLVKMFEHDPEQTDKDEDGEDDYVVRCKSMDPLILNELDMSQEAHTILMRGKERGITIADLAEALCIPLVWARTTMLSLDNQHLGKSVMTTRNRQRLRRMVSMLYLHKNETVKFLKANKEMDTEVTANLSILSQDDLGSAQQLAATPNKSTENDEKEDDFPRNKKLAESLNLQNLRRGAAVADKKFLSRQSFMLKTIDSLKIVTESVRLFKALVKHEEEDPEFSGRCCRKSFNRLLQKMEEKKLINVHRFQIGDGTDKKMVSFYCAATIQRDDEAITQEFEQIKFRHATRRVVAKKTNPPKEKVLKKDSSPETAGSDTDDERSKVPIKLNERQKYDYQARFTRLKHLHLFLFRLVYGKNNSGSSSAMTGKPAPGTKDDGVKVENYDWLQIRKELPSYIQGEGWFKVGDILSIMPLVLFCQCGGIRLESKTVARYLKDPTKRLMFTSELPPKLTAKLLSTKQSSHILMSFMQCMVFMVHMGLVRLKGDTVLQNRKQMMLYLTKKTILRDTTISEKSYDEVILPEGTEAFPTLNFNFSTVEDVFKYWSEVEFICLNTPLGYKGKRTRPKCIRNEFGSLREVLAHFTEDDITKCEPKLLGDGVGAGGFDSYFYSHLNRNWKWKDSKKPRKHGIKQVTVKARPVPPPVIEMNVPVLTKSKKKTLLRRKRILEGTTTTTKKRKRMAFTSAIKSQNSFKTNKRLEDVVASRLLSLHQKREAQKRRLDKRMRSVKVDEADHHALKRRRGLRATFSSREDGYLLRILVGINLMKIDPKFQSPWREVRDLIHKEFEESKDKTAQSLSRRCRQMMKNPESKTVMKSCVIECMGLQEFAGYRNWNNSNWKKLFLELVEKLGKKYKKRPSPVETNIDIPRSYEELLKNFSLYETAEPKTAQVTPETVDDATKLILRDLVHNSIAGRYGSGFIPSIVYRIFQSYPTAYVDDAVNAMRKLGLISKVRCSLPRHRCLPISTLRYDLSMKYDRIVESLMPGKAFSVARQTHQELMKSIRRKDEAVEPLGASDLAIDYHSSTNLFHYDPGTAQGGLIAHMLSLLVRNQLILNVDLPDRTVLSKNEMSKENKSMYEARIDFNSHEDNNLNADGLEAAKRCDEQTTPGEPSTSGVSVGIKRKASENVDEASSKKKCCLLRRVDSSGSKFNIEFAFLHKKTIETFQRTTWDTSHVDFIFTDKVQEMIEGPTGKVLIEYQPIRKFFANLNAMLHKTDKIHTQLRPPAIKPDDVQINAFPIKFKEDVKPYLEFLDHQSETDSESLLKANNASSCKTREWSLEADQVERSMEPDEAKKIKSITVNVASEGQSLFTRFLSTSDCISISPRSNSVDILDLDTYVEILRHVFSYDEEDVKFNILLLESIKKEKQLGLTASAVNVFYKDQGLKMNIQNDLDDHLLRLQNFKLVMEAGAVAKRYVSTEFSLLWCLKSPVWRNKISPGGGRDSTCGSVSQETELAKEKDAETIEISASAEDETDKGKDLESSRDGVDMTTYDLTNESTEEGRVVNSETWSLTVDDSINQSAYETAASPRRKRKPQQEETLNQLRIADQEDPLPGYSDAESAYVEERRRPKRKKRRSDQGSGNEDSGNGNETWRITRLRPWLELNGDLNPSLLKRFQAAILSYIMFNPGIRKDAIVSQYSCLLRPVAISDILDYLVFNQAVSVHYMLQYPEKRSLFGSGNNNRQINHDNPYYLPSLSCIYNTIDVDRDF